MDRRAFIGALALISCQKMSLKLFHIQNKSAGGNDFSNSNIVAYGNSLTYGDQSSNPSTKSYPAILKTLSPFNVAGCTITNTGVSGRTTQQLISNQASVVDTLFASGKRNIVLVFEMINDLYVNCLSGAAAEANMATLCTNLQASGWEVWVGGTTVRQVSIAPGDICGSTGANLESRSDTANGLVAANWTTYADGYVDLRSDATLNGNPTYMADNIHFNDAGYDRLAQIFKNYLTA
jgi:lysophospholipase L1-like esterase